MFRVVTVVLLAIVVTATVAFAQDNQPQEKPKSEVDLAYVSKYLDRMKLKYEKDEQHNVAHMVMVGDNGKFDTHVLCDPQAALAYIIITDYLTVPPTHRNCDKVLRRLMELNWKLNLGKFEWDPSDGEVRFTFTFSTENGIGFEAFQAVFNTMIATADDQIEGLQKLLVED
ncbi:MAG: YbjN domain-containing protein [Armatimonadetes bacterium]|nr:YbjN domain-containing protein [Armatimonadota bacterium]